MKAILRSVLSLVFIVLCSVSFSQAQPKPARYNIGKSGCTVSFPVAPAPAESNFSEDSSMVYTISATKDKFNYDVIVVKFKESVASESRAELLQSYMDYLKKSFEMGNTSDYAKGLKLAADATVIGMSCSWTKDNEHGKMCGWVRGDYLAVLLFSGENEFPAGTVVPNFLNSIKFPGTK